LAHVRWLGGAPDAGKTTVARALAHRFGLRLYLLDDAQPAHWARATRARQPALHAFAALTMDERWVLPTPRQMAHQIVVLGAERAAMAVEDLLALPPGPPILVEGPWLFPEVVAPLLTDSRRALWLVPTEAFKRASAARRDKPRVRHQTNDAARTVRNWWERDRLLEAHVRAGADSLGLPVWEVDGSRTTDEMTALVADHYGLQATSPPYLCAARPGAASGAWKSCAPRISADPLPA
jgi:2-phosphoglycerate kinase